MLMSLFSLFVNIVSGAEAFVYMKLSSRYSALKSSPAWLSSIRPQEHLGVPWFESLNYLGPNPCTGRLHEMTECLFVFIFNDACDTSDGDPARCLAPSANPLESLSLR